jgi:ATP-binding cassette subfamily F protein 3
LKETKLEEGRARKILNRFGISTEDVYKNTSTLSPGEYSRMIIAKLVALNPNCIILDEPSNHLDLDVLSVLENGLSDYTGTLIVISHDRYFVDKIKTSTKIKL